MRLEQAIALQSGEELIEREDGPIRRMRSKSEAAEPPETGAYSYTGTKPEKWFDDPIRKVKAGGPGSGCQGPNCGRPGGHKEVTHTGVSPDDKWQYGGCYAFAKALKARLPEGKYVGVWSLHEENWEHVGLKYNGKIYDSEGAHSSKEFLKRFQGEDKSAHELRPVPETTINDRYQRNFAYFGKDIDGKDADTQAEAAVNKYYTIKAGGPGSGCQGENCGRKSTGKAKETEPDQSHPMSRQRRPAKRVVGDLTPEQIQKFLDSHKKWEEGRMEADFEGEPSGTMQHAHISPIDTFHPPSLVKRGKQDHVPVDDVGETNDKYLDVTKRNSEDTWDQRMKLLKRSAPGGAPALIPARTTLIPTHQGSYNPLMASAKPRLKQRPINWDKQPRQFTSYGRRGSI